MKLPNGYGSVYKLSGKRTYSAAFSGFVVTLLRYICHIFSGILIWGVYAKEGQSVLAYSLIYNGTYMIPEILITTVVLALIFRLKRTTK